MSTVEGSEFTLPADLVLIATGFTRPAYPGLLDSLGVDLDGHGNVAADTGNDQTSRDGVFAAGDMRRGQSLVVWAIQEGRECAAAGHTHLIQAAPIPA